MKYKLTNKKIDYLNAKVYGNAEVCGNAKVYGNAWVHGDAEVCGDADYLVIGPIGSRNDITTFFKTANNDIKVSCGCFTGTIEEFLEKVNETHGNNNYAKNKYQKSIVYDIIKRKNIRLERRNKMNYLYDVEIHILVTIDMRG